MKAIKRKPCKHSTNADRDNEWVPLTRVNNFNALHETAKNYKVVYDKVDNIVDVFFFKCASIKCPFALRGTRRNNLVYEVDQRSTHDRYCKYHPENPQQREKLHSSSLSHTSTWDENGLFYIPRRRKMFKREPIEIIDLDTDDDIPEIKPAKIFSTNNSTLNDLAEKSNDINIAFSEFTQKEQPEGIFFLFHFFIFLMFFVLKNDTSVQI